MRPQENPRWFEDVDPNNLVAAQDYLTLLLNGQEAAQLVARLKTAKPSYHRANDLLRANRVPALSAKDPGVKNVIEKINAHAALNPVLVVSWPDRGAEIVDGYHRVCACYLLAPNTPVLCYVTTFSG